MRLTGPYGAFTEQITAHGRCYAVRFGAEEYRRHGLSSFFHGGENITDGGWAVSFSTRKQAMEHSRHCRAASRCGSRAARVPLSRNAPRDPLQQRHYGIASSAAIAREIVGWYSYFHQSLSCNLPPSQNARDTRNQRSQLFVSRH